MKPLRLKQSVISPLNASYYQRPSEVVGVSFSTVGFQIGTAVPPEGDEALAVSYATVGFQIGQAVPPQANEGLGLAWEMQEFAFKSHPSVEYNGESVRLSYSTAAFEHKTHPSIVVTEALQLGYSSVGFEFTGQSAGLLWDATLMSSPPWMLFDDLSGLVESSGAVSQWGDRSGNGWHMEQTSASIKPEVVSNALSGRRVVRFGGNDRLLAPGAGGALRNAKSGWMFAVAKKAPINTAAGNYAVFVISTNLSGYSRLALFDSASVSPNRHTFKPYVRRLDSDDAVGSNSVYDSAQNWTMVLATIDYNANVLQHFINSELDTTISSILPSAGLTSNTASYAVTMGADSNGNIPFTGDIACLAFGRGLPTLSETDKLFAHYAHRYGLQSLLPADHPYKTFPPYAAKTAVKMIFEDGIFSDQSGKGWSNGGSAAISTAQSYSGGSSYYNPPGTSGYLSTSNHEDFDLSKEDFCIEAWCRPTGTSTSSRWGTIIGKRSSATDFDWVLFQDQTNRSACFSYGDGSAAQRDMYSSVNSLPADTWTHVAVSRYRNTLRLWVNGTLASTHTIVGEMRNRVLPVDIGKCITYADSYWAGWLDDVKITKGEAVYYNAFVPPTLPPPSVGAGNDPY